MTQSVKRCSLCDFPWFSGELDGHGRCQACQAVVAEVRKAALEEAATAVEQDLCTGLMTPGNVKQAAKAIRALIGKP